MVYVSSRVDADDCWGTNGGIVAMRGSCLVVTSCVKKLWSVHAVSVVLTLTWGALVRHVNGRKDTCWAKSSLSRQRSLSVAQPMVSIPPGPLIGACSPCIFGFNGGMRRSPKFCCVSKGCNGQHIVHIDVKAQAKLAILPNMAALQLFG